MKKLLLIAAAVFVFAATTDAQTSASSLKGGTKKVVTVNKKENLEKLKPLQGTVVNPAAKNAFTEIYGNIPAVWKRTTNYDQVTFTSGDEEKISYYDADAKLVGTIIQKKFEDLPDDAQVAINKKYPGYKKEAVAFYDDNELNTTDIVVFNKQFEDEDCYYVKLKKDNDEILVKVKQSGEVYFFKKIK
jgi:hypothetical protein